MHICLFAAVLCMTTLMPVLAQAAPPPRASSAVTAPKVVESPQKPPTAARNLSKPEVTLKVESPQVQPPAARPDSADRLFIRFMAASTSMVADVGELAVEKASNDNVKTFGAQMLESNLTTQAWIEDLARQQEVTLPNEPQAEQKAARARLESLEGLPFDMAFLQVQLIEHQKTLQLLQWEISFGQDVQVQRLAMEMLPTVLNRLQSVQLLMAETADLAIANQAEASPSQVVAEESPQEMAEDNVQEPAQQTTEIATEIRVGKATGRTAERVTERATDRATEKAPEKATGKTAQKAAGKIAGKTADKSADKTADKAADKTTEKVTGKTTEKVARKAAEKPVEKAAKKATEEKVDERVGEKADNSAEPDVMSTIRRL